MSVLVNDFGEMTRIPRENPVKPTVIVENVIKGLMWPFFRSVLPGFSTRTTSTDLQSRVQML